MRQAFFIGDGLTGTGTGTPQTFVVPAGATRLFLGTTDGVEWSNNSGSFAVVVTAGAAGVTPTPTVAPPTLTPTSTPTVAPPTLTPTSTPTVAPPTLTPTATATVVPAGPAPNVPTLSFPMLALFGLALATAAMFLVRRP